MSNKRLEVPYSVRIQETKERLRAKRAQMEKNVHIRSKVAKNNLDNEKENVLSNKEDNIAVTKSVKKLSNSVKNPAMSDDDKRRDRLRQMVVITEILSKPISMRKRHCRRGKQ